jgi:hypothetical protein
VETLELLLFLGLFSYKGDPALTLLQADNQQKAAFDGMNLLSINKTSNLIQDKGGRGKKR